MSVWPHCKVPWDETAGLGAQQEFWAVLPGQWARSEGCMAGQHGHRHAQTQGYGKQQLKQKMPQRCTVDPHWHPVAVWPNKPIPDGQMGSPLQPEGHRTALSPCISYRWSLRNCLAVLWASGWRREQGQIQANYPFVWSCSVMSERQRPHTHRLANNHTQLINIKMKG